MKLLQVLLDDQYSFKGIKEKRLIARAILLNEHNEICLEHLYGDDAFGHRDYYETPGGGIEENESLIDGLKREVEEELGYKIKVIQELGLVIDNYNLIARENYNYYFLAKVIGSGQKHQTLFEQKMIKSRQFYSLEDAIKKYEDMQNELVGALVKQRELPILYLIRDQKILEAIAKPKK